MLAGLSVDPDDVTRQGVVDAGALDMLYGAPILPGAMMLLARIHNIPVIGVPACALYFKTSGRDLLLPRVLAEVSIIWRDLVRMGHGAFCLSCNGCKYPRRTCGREFFKTVNSRGLQPALSTLTHKPCNCGIATAYGAISM